jgi:hypothetical protein
VVWQLLFGCRAACCISPALEQSSQGTGLPSTPSAQHTHRAGYGGHTTNMPIEDLLETPTWIALAHG